jgi:hypothetical protein
LRPPAGGSSAPSFGRKLFIDAHASISVPSTEMLPTQELPNLRLVEHRRQEPGRGFALEQPVAVGRERGRVHTGSSIPSPTNQRNSRL